MNSREYLERLEACLTALDAVERDSVLRFYQEYIEDAGEENLDRVIAKLGPPEALARKLIAEIAAREPGGRSAVSRRLPSRQSASRQSASDEPGPRRRWSPWIIVLLVLASPLLVGLAGAGAGLLVGLAALIGSAMLVAALMALVPFIVAGALCLGGAATGLMGLTLLFRDTATMLVFVGGGLTMFCLGALAIIPCLNFMPRAYRGVAGMGRYMAFKAAELKHAVGKGLRRP